ncbi:DUF1398 domain-containing protein [Rhodoligotrophos defluvii]|uniref:DUF1398 domain-containing protein n=1 Tax=Rhodoligotrophos defluvii TaxID=2561934 RepID=UPI0010C986A5|nr:DUF1398 family protein [Rhodoligotrophos defluvii]
MEEATKAVVRHCTEGSDSGRLNFGDVVKALAAAGVERYHADLVRAEKTYYMPDDTSEVVPCHAANTAAPATFSGAAVEAAIRDVQAGAIDYLTFCSRIAAAGCTGYFVSLLGKRAVYYGRTGDSHVEFFPDGR